MKTEQHGYVAKRTIKSSDGWLEDQVYTNWGEWETSSAPDVRFFNTIEDAEKVFYPIPENTSLVNSACCWM